MEIYENSGYEHGGENFRRRKVVETPTGKYRADCDDYYDEESMEEEEAA
jgi:hypothetical protein